MIGTCKIGTVMIVVVVGVVVGVVGVVVVTICTASHHCSCHQHHHQLTISCKLGKSPSASGRDNTATRQYIFKMDDNRMRTNTS